ncbi:hypothetical protein BCV69DRAFT_281652 [Microstroma glucosiphilum]|uniref:Fumarylacetoacetase-like C-terminal domain-containing protein n=1 Tax=Pseudomicrostroma glucosiphilum TaxID=1684307 RepID=A0A316UF10_9BASI|nr:hypothetical protein BCV69DRAFT_281652 [Pseudomicrostroma glucosiphilum]PWN21715.1 hypothetical protein BCV69DRAFT_281652 [Pseudomicrostroma glucosiphilum]
MPPWTRLIRFVAAEDHQIYTGQPLDDSLDIGQAYSSGQPIKARLLSAPSLLDDPLHATLSDQVRTVKALLPPLDPQRVGTIRALGANFVQPGQNEVEAKKNRPPIPILFYKPATALGGPEGEIVVPLVAREGGVDQADYEVELGVVLSRPTKDITASEASAHILAYTLTNDVSFRKRMFAVPQWGLGKSFDGSLPIGPVLVHPSLIPNPEDVRLKTEVNGKTVQEGSTSQHLWKVFETVAQLSQGTTLPAGTLISMGTPPGEGFKQNPPRWLKHGDLVVVSGDKGLGSLRNWVREEGVQTAVKAKL